MEQPIRYGHLPRDLGEVRLNVDEMGYWLYMPVSTPQMSSYWSLPPNITYIKPILERVYHDCKARFMDEYVYVTVKSMLHSGDTVNRPGWHADGYGTEGDLNYVWCDAHPTEFLEADFFLGADELDHEGSMRRFTEEADRLKMEYYADLSRDESTHPIKTYADRHLLRLDPSVIHRVNPRPFFGRRTFVKVSVSKHVYNLVGNTINHDLPTFPLRPRFPRDADRNHPYKKA